MAVAVENRSGESGSASILFENADVLAASKPEGLAAIPERDRRSESLHQILQALAGTKLYVVHRIDKDASGVILYAKNAAAHRCLNDQFTRREVVKTYLALVHGVAEVPRGRIDEPIRAYGSGRMGIDRERGKPSSTSYEVVRALDRCTLVRVQTSSGRRHQIRVHFYSLGHPIVGDRRYGDRATQERYPRLMLHAWSVSFRLPSGESTTVESPLPQSFSSVLDAVQKTRRPGEEG
jgi:RluA family pseudouridine synthase